MTPGSGASPSSKTYPTGVRWSVFSRMSENRLEQVEKSKIDIILDFRDRAQRLKIQGTLILLVVLVALVAGAYVFVWLPRWVVAEEGLVDRIIEQSTKMGLLQADEKKIRDRWTRQQKDITQGIYAFAHAVGPPANYFAESLLAVHFSDRRNGWAVGRGGAILATTNGGNTWKQQTSGTSNTLIDVHFSDSRSGWAVGNEGTILSHHRRRKHVGGTDKDRTDKDRTDKEGTDKRDFQHPYWRALFRQHDRMGGRKRGHHPGHRRRRKHVEATDKRDYQHPLWRALYRRRNRVGRRGRGHDPGHHRWRKHVDAKN